MNSVCIIDYRPSFILYSMYCGVLKGGVCNKKKRFRKLSQGRVPKQSCSQSSVRGVSTHDVEERAFGEQPSRVTER